MRPFFLAVLLLLTGAPAAAATPGQLSALDAQMAQRADPATARALDAALTQALQAAPQDYALLWRAARMKAWLADGAEGKAKQALGKEAWTLGDRAVAADPTRVEGHYWAAAGVGTYAQGLGVVSALGQGVEGKFNARLDKALAIDPDYERGSPRIAKGRYHYELPWPKRDLGASARLLREAAERHPENLRAHLYLAETLLKQDKPKEAQASIAKVLQGSVTYDPAEGRRIQALAAPVAAKIEKELK